MNSVKYAIYIRCNWFVLSLSSTNFLINAFPIVFTWEGEWANKWESGVSKPTFFSQKNRHRSLPLLAFPLRQMCDRHHPSIPFQSPAHLACTLLSCSRPDRFIVPPPQFGIPASGKHSLIRSLLAFIRSDEADRAWIEKGVCKCSFQKQHWLVTYTYLAL